ncbi:MAG TPA: bis(5'-nucleosyl)-tetraphosphatase (symmetrical) YqeK [Firmicutes bacterium]|nr:bis(5'-nucleosyl)-tetraphosphatase (symmetrical) YqeK [Bacillota bacterium]
MQTDEQFTEIIRGRLTDKRFRHSLAVAEQAARLAPLYGADPQKARTAGILHDILKDEKPAALLQILRDFDIILDNAERVSPNLWHAIAGAAFIERVLHVDDPEIVAAVRYHTTGRAGMSPLEKTLFVADFTSADRKYDDVEEMRRLAEKGSAPAMEYGLAYTIRDLAERGLAIHPDAVYAYNELVAARLEGRTADGGKA